MAAPQAINLENRLRFEFDDNWRAFKWDEADEYTRGIRKLDGARAVDIFADDGQRLWLIEGKDPRAHWRHYRKELRELPQVIADKVRDTLAGATWAIGRFPKRVPTMLKVLFIADVKKVHVVLWLEGVQEAEAIALQEETRRALAWLNPKVIVTDRRLLRDGDIPGLTVTSLPGAPPRP